MKKFYEIVLLGESDGRTIRELTDEQYELIKGICEDTATSYEFMEIKEVIELWSTEVKLHKGEWIPVNEGYGHGYYIPNTIKDGFYTGYSYPGQKLKVFFTEADVQKFISDFFNV